MALSSTIFKVDLSIADIDRGYYGEHALTIARHPSETDERLMVRLVAFAHAAADGLAFGRGLSTEDEPDLVLTDLTGAIRLWIDVGLPDEKAVRRAAGRAEAVRVYAYGGRAVDVWWDRVGGKLARQERVSVVEIPRPASEALAARVDRNMRWQCTIQDGSLLFAGDSATVPVDLAWRSGAPDRH
jgi:uncharacterized protein YaeQ